ncbi:MAG TPA: glycosyltransferase family 4 protein, partial [Gaiellaceae bacterium]|nr:glycosyltransferase family 4 protein [Gaiellaceae bacterium]
MTAGLRVAICFGTFPPHRNGGADFLARFASALAAAGCDVHVLTSAGDGPTAERLPSGVVVHRVIEDWTIRRARPSLRALRTLLESEQIELVHVVFPDSVVQGRYQLPALLGSRGVPLVTTFWNLGLGRRSPPAVRLTALALLLRSAALSSHDPGYLAALRRLAVGRKPVHWLPVGSNFDHVGARELRDGGPLRLGYFGQLDFTRGVDTLFEALARLGRRDLRLVMLGSAGRPERYAEDSAAEAEFRRLLALPEQLGIGDLVEWTGFLDDDEVPDALASLDLCVLPYRRNSLGRSALAAALAAGVPVVLGGRPDRIAPLRPGEHVALVPPDDPGALAATIGRLLDDEAERARLADGARAAA